MTKNIIFILLILLFKIPAFSQSTTLSFSDKKKEALYSKALILQTENKYDESISILNSILPIKSNPEYIYYNLAYCYFKKLNFLKAEELAFKAININEQYIKPYLLIYDIYDTLKNDEESAFILGELNENIPGQVNYLYQCAVINYNDLKNFDAAQYYFNKIINLSNKESLQDYYIENSYLMLKEINYKKGKYIDAILNLEKAVNINNKHNFKFFTLGSRLYSKYHFNLATVCFQTMIDNLSERQKKSNYLKKLYSLLGQLYFISNNPKSTGYLRLGSGDEKGSEYISKALFNYIMGRSDESLIMLYHSLKEYPDNIAALIAYGKLSKKRGDIDNAKKYFEKALTIVNPEKTDLFNTCNYLFDELIKISPGDFSLILGKAKLYERFQLNNMAIYYYKKYLKEHSDVEPLIHVAYLYNILKKKEKSKKYFNLAKKENPSYARTYFIEGLVETNSSNYKKSEDLFKKCIKLDDKDDSYYFYTAFSLEKQGKTKESINYLEKALELNANNDSYQNYLGYLYADLNINIEKSKILIEKALASKPYNGAYLDSLGWLYFQQGKYKTALKYLLKAKINLKATNAEDPAMYDHLGDVYSKLNNKSKAIKFWKKSLTLKPDIKIEKKIKKYN